MPAHRSDVEYLLERILRFRREEGDHDRFRLEIDGKLIARAKTPYSHSTISDGLLAEWTREIGIPPRFLKDLLARRRTRNDYLDALRRGRLLP